MYVSKIKITVYSNWNDGIFIQFSAVVAVYAFSYLTRSDNLTFW